MPGDGGDDVPGDGGDDVPGDDLPCEASRLSYVYNSCIEKNKWKKTVR